MKTTTPRPDYAKFIVDTEQDHWSQLYRRFCAEGRAFDDEGDFLKHHHVTVWQSQHPGLRKYILEVWGEATSLVFGLAWETWHAYLRRFDVRVEEPELTTDMILELGTLLQATCSKFNVNTYRTRPAAKRQGRDRGGVGYAIGSHKSNLRVTCYKRGSEPACTEAQVTGVTLQRAVDMADRDRITRNLTNDEAWAVLVDHLDSFGQRRIEAAWQNYSTQLRFVPDTVPFVANSE